MIAVQSLTLEVCFHVHLLKVESFSVLIENLVQNMSLEPMMGADTGGDGGASPLQLLKKHEVVPPNQFLYKLCN